jgi:hypothetical protein
VVLVGDEVTVERSPHHHVALAGEVFQALPVNNPNQTALVINQPPLLQFMSGFADASPPDPKHDAHKFMRQWQEV